jgi:hypothetical protein
MVNKVRGDTDHGQWLGGGRDEGVFSPLPARAQRIAHWSSFSPIMTRFELEVAWKAGPAGRPR